MTKILSRMNRRLFGVAATIAVASSATLAQIPANAPTPVLTGAVVPLSLGDAARVAARQSAISRGARLRADEAGARVRERKSELLPNLSSYVQEAGRTFNTSTLGIDFPATPGNPPLFDPQGQVEGPINTLDVRGHVQQNLLDFGALGRVRSAQADARASSADADATAEQAATTATNAYVRAMRADADLRARQAEPLGGRTELLACAGEVDQRTAHVDLRLLLEIVPPDFRFLYN